MARFIWLKVTNDKYEFPVAMALSQSELERKLNLKYGHIASAIYHAEKNGWKCSYKKVEITEEEYREFRGM